VFLAAAAAITLGLSSALAETPTFPNTFFTQLPGVIAKPATGSATATTTTQTDGRPVQLYPSKSTSGTWPYHEEGSPTR
jgi:hypothetical protein